MDDYLAKPLSRAALREVLARWLPAGAAAATPAPVETLVPATADVLDRGTLNALRALPRKGTKDMLSHIVERYLTDSWASCVRCIRACVKNCNSRCGDQREYARAENSSPGR